MASSISSKEARRRKIVDRGSDRLALITGRIQTLPPPSSSSSESHQVYASSGPPSLSHHQHHPSSNPSDQHNHAVLPEGEDTDGDPLLQKLKSNEESGLLIDYNGRNGVQPLLHKCETRIEASTPSAFELNEEMQSFADSSTVRNPLPATPNTRSYFEPQMLLRKVFSLSQISCAISASESTRMYCSIVAALLIVLSNIGFPILGSHIVKSTVFSKPLYLLLLTNISIVFARVLLRKHSRSESVEQEQSVVPSMGGHGLPDRVGHILETSLALQNVVFALLMDCGVYAVVLICGLSLVQKFGW